MEKEKVEKREIEPTEKQDKIIFITFFFFLSHFSSLSAREEAVAADSVLE